MTDTDDDIITEAKARLKQAIDWEAYFRTNFRFDKRFDAGDSVNNYQWPNAMYLPRANMGKACLTTNKVHQHVLQVTNDARQNKPEVKISPVGNGATFGASVILEGIVRHIEYISNATDAYDCATNDQVVGGIGWWRVVTDYASDDSFDQEIFIRRISDAMSIYLDPDIKEFDGSDARYGFCFKDMARDDFNKEYPEFKDQVDDSAALGTSENEYNWYGTHENHVRVVEYYRRIEVKDRLHLLPDGSLAHESEAKKEPGLLAKLRAVSLKQRDIMRHEVEWFLCANDKIIDRADWPGKYIPLVRIIGEENVIDGTLDRKGLIRAMTDSQRVYNVSNSSAIEHLSGQTKTPWLASKEATEGLEQYWDEGNIKQYSVLFWNSLNDAGEATIPPPQRIAPPEYAPGYQQALAQAANDMQGVSGMFEAQFGQTSNERSGKAINERVRNGNNSTFHFINNLAVGIKYTGKIILDLLPHVYDVPRVLKIMGQDGTMSTVALDPQMQQAHSTEVGMDYESFSPQQVAQAINPKIGLYDVEANVGPSYGTRRMETFNALTQILSQNESLTPVIGDLLFKVADFPMADEISQRMQQHFNSQADPAVQQAQQTLAQQHTVMMAQAQEIEQLKSKALTQEMQKEIDWYKAETDRAKVMSTIDPAAFIPIIRQQVSEMLGMPANQLIAQHMIENSQMIQAANPDPQQQAQTQQNTQGPQQ